MALHHCRAFSFSKIRASVPFRAMALARMPARNKAEEFHGPCRAFFDWSGKGITNISRKMATQAVGLPGHVSLAEHDPELDALIEKVNL